MPIVSSEGITSPITSFSDLSSRPPSNDKELFGVWIGMAYSLGQDHLCLIRRDDEYPIQFFFTLYKLISHSRHQAGS